jgi:hypothetical protein
VLINGSDTDTRYTLPGQDCEIYFSSAGPLEPGTEDVVLPALSIAVLRRATE